MPASTAAPTSSTWMCTFHSPSPPTTTSESPSGARASRSGGMASSSASRRYITSYAGPFSVRSPVGSLAIGIAEVPTFGVVVVGCFPVIADSAASRTTHSPRPPASTTPASLSRGSCSGVRASASRAASAAACTTAPSRSSGASAALVAAVDAAFATERIVPSTGSPTAEYAASVASSIPSANTVGRPVVRAGLADPAQECPDELAEDHPGVATGTEQSAAGVGLHARPQVAGVLLEGFGQRVAGRLDGQEHVGPGVTVGHRVDVQGVDLLAGRRQAIHGQVREPAYDVEVEGGNLIACLHPSYSLGVRCGRHHRSW